jgi:ABC-type sugar transport system permease subunit
MFDEAYIMTQGGPVGSTVTLVFQMWNTAFSNFRFGEAASISVIILLFILTATFIQFRLSREPKESM